MLKIKLGDIDICSSSIPKEYKDRYHALYARSTEQMASNSKHLHTDIEEALVLKQTLAVANLLGKCVVAVSGGTSSSLPMSTHSFSLVQSSLAAKVRA